MTITARPLEQVELKASTAPATTYTLLSDWFSLNGSTEGNAMLEIDPDNASPATTYEVKFQAGEMATVTAGVPEVHASTPVIYDILDVDGTVYEPQVTTATHSSGGAVFNVAVPFPPKLGGISLMRIGVKHTANSAGVLVVNAVRA